MAKYVPKKLYNGPVIQVDAQIVKWQKARRKQARLMEKERRDQEANAKAMGLFVGRRLPNIFSQED